VQVFLIGLGAFLIYSLLLSDVESKVYESGMLRALGMEQYTLIMLLAIQVRLYITSITKTLVGVVKFAPPRFCGAVILNAEDKQGPSFS